MKASSAAMCWARCFSVCLLISFSQQSQGVMGKESERSTNLARGTQLVNRRGVTGCPHHVCLKKNLMVFINFKNEDIVDLQCYINFYGIDSVIHMYTFFFLMVYHGILSIVLYSVLLCYIQ